MSEDEKKPRKLTAESVASALEKLDSGYSLGPDGKASRMPEQTTVAGNVARDVGNDVASAGKWVGNTWMGVGDAMKKAWMAPGNAIIRAANVGPLPSETPVNDPSKSPLNAGQTMAMQANGAGAPQTEGSFAPEATDRNALVTWGGAGGSAPHMARTSEHRQYLEKSPEMKQYQSDVDKYGNEAIEAGAKEERAAQELGKTKGDLMLAELHGDAGKRHINEGRRGIEKYYAEQDVRDKKFELEEAPASIHEVFQKQGVAGKIFMAIGTMLGAAGGTLSGTGNSFAHAIEGSIAAELGKKSHQLDFSYGAMKDLNARQLQEKAAERQHADDALRAVDQEMAAMALKAGNDPGVQKNLAAGRMQLAELRAKLELPYAPQIAENNSLVGGGMGGMGGMAGTMNAEQGQLIDMGDGSFKIANSVKEGESINSTIALTRELDGYVNAMEDLDTKASKWDMARPDVANQYKQIRQGLVTRASSAMSNATKQGTVRESEIIPYARALSGHTPGVLDAVGLSNNRAAYAASRAAGRNIVNSAVSTQHGPRVGTRTIMNNKGQYQQVIVPMQDQHFATPGTSNVNLPSSAKPAGR